MDHKNELCLRGTLCYQLESDPVVDAGSLHKALAKTGVDEDAITDLIGHRTIEQRAQIRRAYREMYDEDLDTKIMGSLTGDYENLVRHLFRLPLQILAYDLYKALRGGMVCQKTLTSILCCCTNYEIHHLKSAYTEVVETESSRSKPLMPAGKPPSLPTKKTTGTAAIRIKSQSARQKPGTPKKPICAKAPKTKSASTTPRPQANKKPPARPSLEEDVMKYTRGDYAIFLKEILQAQRCEDSLEDEKLVRDSSGALLTFNKELVHKDVEELYKAGQGGTPPKQKCSFGAKKPTNNPQTYIAILTKRSRLHVISICRVFRSVYKMSLVQYITEKFSEPLRTAFNTFVMAQLNLRLLLICQLYSSVDGLGTDERTLARIVCLRAEKDLDELKREYRRYFGEELNEKIHSDTSGQFQKLLLTLVGESGRRV